MENLGPEKIILTYDGIKYRKQTVREILTEDNFPTGHFLRIVEKSDDTGIVPPIIPDDEETEDSTPSTPPPAEDDDNNDEEVLTILGTYLDNDNNYKQFKKDFYDFIKVKVGLINYNPYVHLIIGDSQIFSLQHTVAINSSIKPAKSYSNLFEAFISIIKTLGYVNDAPEFVKYGNYNSIKIIITSKTKPLTKKEFYFISMDSYAHKYLTAGSA